MSEQGGSRWTGMVVVAGAVVAVSAGIVVNTFVFGAEPRTEDRPKPVVELVQRLDAGTPQPVATTDEAAPHVDHAALAAEQIASGDAQAAVASLTRAVQTEPGNVELHWKLARLDEGEIGMTSLAAIAKLDRNDKEAPMELARRRFDRGEYDQALAAAKEAQKRDPASWQACHLAGRAELERGNASAAVIQFERATERPHAPSYPFNNLGYALLLAGRHDDALDALETAIERGPVTHYMLNNLGLAYEKVGRLDDAELAFQGALELKGDYVKAAVNLDRVDRTLTALAREEAEPFVPLALDDDETAPEVAIGADEEEPELLPGG